MTDIIQHDIEIPDLAEAVDSYFNHKAAARENSVAGSIYASELGHPCERYLIYRQTHKLRRKMSGDLMQLFDLGDEHEERAIRVLRSALRDDPKWDGFDIVEQQARIPDNPENIHGYLDCSLQMPYKGKRIRLPLEIKGLHEAIFNKVNTVDDMKNASAVFLRKYPAQLTIYEYYTEQEWGLFVIVNKANGKFKFIPCHLDLEYAEGLLQKAERIRDTVKEYKSHAGPAAGIETEKQKACLPDRMMWTQTVCGRCPMLNVCMPDMSEVPGVENLLGNEELDDAVSTMLQYKRFGSEFNKSDKQIKEHLKTVCNQQSMKKGDQKTFMLPSWNIEVVMQERTGYAVPKEIKAEYKTTSVFSKIKSIDKAGG